MTELVAKSSNPHSRLLSLPLEIRDHIQSYLQPTSTRISNKLELPGLKDAHIVSLEPGLCRIIRLACRQLYHEHMELFWRRTSLIIIYRLDTTGIFRSPNCTFDWLPDGGMFRFLQLAKRLSVKAFWSQKSVPTAPPDWFFRGELRSLCSALPNLRRFHFDFQYPFYDGGFYNQAELIRSLEKFLALADDDFGPRTTIMVYTGFRMCFDIFPPDLADLKIAVDRIQDYQGRHGIYIGHEPNS